MLKTVASCLVLACGSLFGQTPDASLTFDAASMKPGTRPPPGSPFPIRGGPGTTDPGQVHYNYVPLTSILTIAYGVKLNQISGPDWIRTERYDIDATLPPQTTKEQLAMMLQNLLKERLHLVAHHERKEEPVYDLTIAKGGLKLKEAEAAGPEGAETPARPKPGSDGFPELPPGRPMIMATTGNGTTRLTGRMEPMSEIVGTLEGMAGRPIIDKTGLTAKYDFKLEFARQPAAAATGAAQPPQPAVDDGGLSLPAAMQQQLGLRLESAKGMIDHVIIDRIDKTPAEN